MTWSVERGKVTPDLEASGLYPDEPSRSNHMAMLLMLSKARWPKLLSCVALAARYALGPRLWAGVNAPSKSPAVAKQMVNFFIAFSSLYRPSLTPKRIWRGAPKMSPPSVAQ